MKKPTWQYFSLEEYQQRLGALRARMQQRGVDVMLVHSPENLYYFERQPDPALLPVPDPGCSPGKGARLHYSTP